jgi:phosphate transport system substrate-binding protein
MDRFLSSMRSLPSMAVLTVVVVLWGTLEAGASATNRTIVVAGNGPEQGTLERLGHAFEREHPGAVVDIQWEAASDPVALVQQGAATFAVAGQGAPGLTATQLGWDGIAVVVYAMHPMRDVTMDQLAAIFSGKTVQWPGDNGRASALYVLNRPYNQNIRQQFEAALDIVGRIPAAAPLVRTDQEAISTVAGSFSAIAFTSLKPALEAVEYGVGISLASVDGVPAAAETVRDGRYPLRRPVLLLSRAPLADVAAAFAAFTASPEGQAIVEENFTTAHVPSHVVSR